MATPQLLTKEQVLSVRDATDQLVDAEKRLLAAVAYRDEAKARLDKAFTELQTPAQPKRGRPRRSAKPAEALPEAPKEMRDA